MVTDAHTQMDFVEFLEAIGMLCEIRISHKHARAGRRFPRVTDSGRPSRETSAGMSRVLSASSRPAHSASLRPKIDLSDSTSALDVGDSIAEVVDKEVEDGDEGEGFDADGLALDRTITTTSSNPREFLDELVYVLDRVCSVVDLDRDTKLYESKGAVVALIRSSSSRRFKGGGGVVEEEGL
jgi:hypothetical protein